MWPHERKARRKRAVNLNECVMANLLDGMSKSFNAVELGDIDHGRRRFVEGVAISAAAAGLL